MTRDGGPELVRTEDDLREALAALERYAPSAESVLSTVRHASGRGRRGRFSWLRPPGVSPWWRRPRLALALGATAAAAGLVIAVLPGSGPPHRRSSPGQAGLPTAASLGRAMLTAFNAASDDIEYSTETSIRHGVTLDVYRMWSWPAQPVRGQLQRDRTVFAERSPQMPAVTVIEDNEVVFITPAPSVSTTPGQLTMVCYAGTGQTACGYGPTNTPAGRWSRVRGKFSAGIDIGAGGMLSPASLARGIASGQWRVMHRTRLEGQPAIELSETGRGPDVIEPLSTLLWVNARTHLPIRMVNGVGQATVTTNEWSYLPPAPANQALLQVPIPPGYPRYPAPRS
ncbi:MAG: hypothetical protein ACRDND_00985 [Streptosporangiaceae bacterium]